MEILGFLLNQDFLDVGAHLPKRFSVAAVFLVHLEDVVVTAEVDDVADLSNRQIECNFLQRRSQRLALDPSPVAALFTRAVFGINLREVIELRFGLRDGHPRTLDEVARTYGITRERIRQLQNIALAKLRVALSKKDAPTGLLVAA